MTQNLYYKQNEDPALWEPNYDESKVPPYTLPELLTCDDGEKVTSAEKWLSKRKKEVYDFFVDEIYGELPPRPDKVEYELLSEKTDEFRPGSIRREIRIHCLMNNGKKHSFDTLLHLPGGKTEKVPVFIGLTFFGNHVVSADPSIGLTGLNGRRNLTLADHENMRGSQALRFPMKEILDRGYAHITASYHDIFPDRNDGWSESIYQLFYDKDELPEAEFSRSSISAWAWGISRIADMAETIDMIDPERMAVYGHSRLGKTALWAGVNDERFSLVCVNNSGCGGAALSKRLYGETLHSMCHKTDMGYWFRKDLWSKALTPEVLKMDQHGLIALAAPRAVAVHSATQDQWADPYGEYLSTYYAGEVYRLFGKETLQQSVLPPPGVAQGTDVSYYLRDGKHAILLEDWLHYMDAADRVFN